MSGQKLQLWTTNLVCTLARAHTAWMKGRTPSLPTHAPACSRVSSQWFPNTTFPLTPPPHYSALGYLLCLPHDQLLQTSVYIHITISPAVDWLNDHAHGGDSFVFFAEYADSPLEEKLYLQALARDLIWLTSWCGCARDFALPVTGSLGNVRSSLSLPHLRPRARPSILWRSSSWWKENYIPIVISPSKRPVSWQPNAPNKHGWSTAWKRS